MIEDCEEVSNLEFITPLIAAPSAIDTAPFETEAGGCMHFRPILEPNDVISAQSVSSDVGMRGQPRGNKDAIVGNRELVKLPQNNVETLSFASPFNKGKLKRARINVNWNTLTFP